VEFSDVIKRRRMVRSFTSDPLPPGTADLLLRAAIRAPSAGFSQGYSFLVLEGEEQTAPFWGIFTDEPGTTMASVRAADLIGAMSRAPLVIVPMACKDVYLERYALPDKGWTDRDEARWPVPYWYIDTGFTALLMLLTAVDEGLGAVFFGIPPGNIADFRSRHGVPEEWMPIGAVAVGYRHPDEEPTGSWAIRERKPLADLVHRGRW
jgi:nitroreductase